jgi:choline dehydrogenase-like flavoprotein
MISDARALPHGFVLDADLCIVGAGAAGITIAREFIGSGLVVCLLESGGLSCEARAQALCAAELDRPEPLPPSYARARCFGGTTSRWSGLCRPLDPIDFEARPGRPWSGWPFAADALDTYYRRAQQICQLGPYAYGADAWSPDGAPLPRSLGGREVRSAVFQSSPPVRFGIAYRREIEEDCDTRVLLHANAIGIEVAGSGRAATAIRVATPAGSHLSVAARHFVLAAGGIENPRLLLAANARFPRGLGNDRGLVGRFYMDHPKIWKAGRVQLARPAPEPGFYDPHRVGGTRIQGAFVPTEEAQRRRGLANFAICLDEASPADFSRGAAAFRAWRRARRLGPLDARETLRQARLVGADLGGFAGAVWRTRLRRERRIFTTRYWCDCPPDPESRVMLSEQRDPFGVPLPRIAWRLPSDLRGQVERAHALLDAALRESGEGLALIAPAEAFYDPLEDVENSCHHMGTTRMDPDPARGVVDEHGRVHGLANLFIAGSSVFPSYGQANPTLTIVALSLRLADHLERLLKATMQPRLRVAAE